MPTNHGFPYTTVRFDRAGAPVDTADVTAARAMVREGGVTDVLVLVHGWNNHMDAAENLYGRFLKSARALCDGELAAPLANRRLGVVGLLWPSMRYTDAALIPGGAASNDPHADFAQVLDEALQVFPDEGHPLRGVLIKLRAQSAVVEDKISLQREFLAAVRDHLAGLDDSDGALPGGALDDLEEVKNRLAVIVQGDSGGTAAGVFSGALGAVRNLLNLTTYYEMKARAALIGQSGAIGLLRDLKRENPELKVHPIGHSFGGRLVSAMARGPDGEPVLPVNSLHLLQAAFSHHGFGEATGEIPEGYFRPVITQRRVSGPILVTHTKNDQAVGIAYVIASALAGQNASSFGGPDDPYGAIGSNGAQHTEVQTLELHADSALNFDPGHVYNLHADLIADHGDVANRGVVRAVLHGVAAS